MTVDAAGAQKLHWRIEQHQHWRQAQSVLDGRQPSVDPDLETLETFGDDLRVYKPRVRGGEVVQVCKRLVDGVWENVTIETPVERSVAHVA